MSFFRTVWAVARHDLTLNAAEPLAFVATLLAPVLFLLMFVLMVIGGGVPVAVHRVDQGVYGQTFKTALESTRTFRVVIPSSHPGAHPVNYFAGLVQGIVWALLHENFFLQLHITVGIVLWLLSLLLIVWAIRIRARGLILTAIVAWVGLTGAGFNGGSFLNEGGMAISSFLMAVGMALAACSYGWAWGSSSIASAASLRI
ncbi:hypothetical protein CEB3_c25780 [Peptococcaceae bacterium CEB3]|nr:hypothetical protein CEB3_c25780 [Peptococcaceae bacterium CEB3]